MEKRLMRFEAFNTYKDVLEKTQELTFADFELNEAFSSTILRNFSKQESQRWSGDFSKDFYKHASVKLDKITNEDFVILSSPEEWWSQGYHKNDNAIGFFVDDNPGFLKALKVQNKMRGSYGNGVVLTIMRGKVGMWYGFGTDPGQSFSRYKKSNQERYGVLADEYDTASKYGWNGGVKAKITKPNLIDVATKVYVLDITSLKAKYSSEEIKTTRAAAVSGAAAFLTNDQVKAENRARYDSALQAGLVPAVLFADIKSTLSKYTTWFQKKVDELTLKNSKDFSDSKVKWGTWDYDIGRPISDMIRFIEEFSRDYDYAMKELKHAEEKGKEMDAAKGDQEKQKIQADIDYYGKSWERYVSMAATKRNEILQSRKDVEKIIG